MVNLYFIEAVGVILFHSQLKLISLCRLPPTSAMEEIRHKNVKKLKFFEIDSFAVNDFDTNKLIGMVAFTDINSCKLNKLLI